MTLIERHGEAGDTPAAALVEAGLMLLQARLRCLAGDEAGALAMYDRVLQVKIAISYPRN